MPLYMPLGKKILERGVLGSVLLAYGIWLTVVVVVLDIAIAIFKDDALENWLQRTPFAKKPSSKPFTKAEKQQRAFEDTLAEFFGLKLPHFKHLDEELKNDHQLTQLQRQRQLCADKDERYTEAHEANNATYTEIDGDTDYQFNRRELERLDQQIQQHTQQVTDSVERYNVQQQQEFANAS